ncbi:hypothetical protein [Streptosporangium sp. NPDC000396]|uniref:scabin-related ADP-ribosyltransferase n=1 Tax=Streptosporangium sp. NPDC000396 TaxID=3366185 RepID=UPI00367EE37A
MALQPPPELAAVMNVLFRWPVVNEDLLLASGRRWVAFGTTMLRGVSTASAHVARTTSRNEGDDVRMLEQESRRTSGQEGDAALAALLIGSALQLSALVVLVMKAALILLLARFLMRLNQLVTASAPTGGASLAGIPALVDGSRLAGREAGRKTGELMERSTRRLFEKASQLLGKSPARQAGRPMPPHRPPTPLRGPDNYLEAAADKNIDVKKITPYPIWRREREPVYRASSRPPDEIFEQGLHPRDPSMTNLGDYVNKGTPSAFVGTSERRDIENVFPRGYVYEVDAPGGIDVNSTIPAAAARLGHEREVAFPGGVHRRYISGAWPAGVPKTPENFIPNPHYDPFPGYPQG